MKKHNLQIKNETRKYLSQKPSFTRNMEFHKKPRGTAPISLTPSKRNLRSGISFPLGS
jgi:hypothetical protein